MRGVIRVNGKDLRDLSVRERAREISYIPQTHAPVYNYKVRDVVLMSTGADVGIFGTPGREQVERAEQALERIGIGHLADRMYTHISGGEQQLVLIARALAQNAKTIVMDEYERARLRQHRARAVVREAACTRGSFHRAVNSSA